MDNLLTDIFNSDLFSCTSLSSAVNNMPFVPGKVGDLGIFEEAGITTTTVALEQQDGVVRLIADQPRGAPGKVIQTNRRVAYAMKAYHLPTRASIMADEIQNVRAFGGSQLQTIEMVRNQKMQSHMASLDATLEYQRIGAIKGILTDADGSTEKLNMFSLMGLTQDVNSMELDQTTTSVRKECQKLKRRIETALGAVGYAGVVAMCGDNFFDTLVSNADVQKTYLNWQEASDLRADKRIGFIYGDVLWINYRGVVTSGVDNSTAVTFIATDEAYAFPTGVPGLFKTRFAPADYVETVNTVGLPRYAKAELMDFGKGIEIEMQTNPISYCERPMVLQKLTTT